MPEVSDILVPQIEEEQTVVVVKMIPDSERTVISEREMLEQIVDVPVIAKQLTRARRSRFRTAPWSFSSLRSSPRSVRSTRPVKRQRSLLPLPGKGWFGRRMVTSWSQMRELWQHTHADRAASREWEVQSLKGRVQQRTPSQVSTW